MTDISTAHTASLPVPVAEPAAAVLCKNCTKEVTAKFCAHCGQPAETPRITGDFMWKEFLRVAINLDKGLIYTLKRMVTHPGLAPLDYVQGKRVIYMKPLTFMAISSAAAKAAVHGFPENFDPNFLFKEIPETLLSMIFVATILCKWFVRDKRYNFWEVLTLQVFLHFLFMAIVAIAVWVLPKVALHVVFLPLVPIYAMYSAWAYWEFYGVLHRPLPMLKCTLVAALQTILLIGDLT